MYYFTICPKCGTTRILTSIFKYDKTCDCSWVGFLKRPKKLIFEVSDQQVTHMYENEVEATCGRQEYEYIYWYNILLRDCTEYDNSLYEEHLNNNKRWDLAAQQRLNGLFSRPTVKCPYCGSLRTTKISTSSRVASSLALGLASNKIGKNYQCNDCKATF